MHSMRNEEEGVMDVYRHAWTGRLLPKTDSTTCADVTQVQYQ